MKAPFIKSCKNATKRVKRDSQEQNNDVHYHHFQSTLFQSSQTVQQCKKKHIKEKGNIKTLTLFACYHYFHKKIQENLQFEYREFRQVAEKKINLQTSAVFLYSSSNQFENVILKKKPFPLAINTIGQLETNQINDV